MAGYRPCYTVDEDNIILQTIVKTRYYYMLRSKAFWQDMESSGFFKRTWQSLKERFERHILPRINMTEFNISIAEKKKISLAYYQTSTSFKSRRLHNFEESSDDSFDDED